MSMGSKSNGEDLLAETRRRSARINLLVDMIPARYYLPGDSTQLLKSAATLDPARAKTTSQLVAEAAAAAGATSETPSAPSGGNGKGASSGKKKKKGAAAGGAERAPADARSRLELREKLERRIKELREERRLKQSERDKAKAAEVRAKLQASGAKRPGDAIQSPVVKAAKGKSGIKDEIEAGKLVFEPKSSNLPFHATVGRRGSKVRDLRKALREEEDVQRKVREAEVEGRGDEVRKDEAMRKALMRARGERVHDDISKLRKTQKVMDKKKQKSKESWSSRIESEKKQGEDKQQKRKDNLQAKRNSKKKLKGKDSGRSGFEGKRSGYLNTEA